MSKMNDLAATIAELRSAAAAVNEAADWLARQFNRDDGTAGAAPEPAAEPELKLEDVRAVLAGMSRKGHTVKIRELLLKYGAPRLSGINPANYHALLKDAEGLEHAG